MNWLPWISLICRLLGLTQWAESLLAKHEAKQAAQAVANIPTTDDEWTKAAGDGDL